MATDKEVDAGARALGNIARIWRGIILTRAEANEAARAALNAAERVRASDGEQPSKIFDYILNGGTEADKQAASMEYLEGVLASVLKERDELVVENERLRGDLKKQTVSD